MRPLVVLGLSLWVLLHLAVGSWILILQLGLEDCEDNDITNFSDAVWRVSLNYAYMFISALGCAAYLYVSFRAPRPWEFHGYGVVLLLMASRYQVLQNYMLCTGLYRARLGLFILSHSLAALRNILIFQLILRKVRALRSSSRRCGCGHPSLWLRALQVQAALFLLAFNIPFYIWGLTNIEAWTASFKEGAGALQGPAVTYLQILRLVKAFALVSTLFVIIACLLSFWLLIRSVLRKLTERNAAMELVTNLRGVLKSHFRGTMAALATKALHLSTLMFGDFVDNMWDFPASLDKHTASLAALGDCIGDIVGIFLLSGLGALLFHEDPDLGDATRLFRSMVHSAVLTSRGDQVFEGRVVMTRTRRCIASFPGKFVSEWHALTWQCEQGELSSACVFLPTTDPQQRFGKHALEDGNRCWCHSLYGHVQPWGCMWFEAWKTNIEDAVRLGLDLVVVYFPGEAGQGEVAWHDLATANLWNNRGLGGSQKAEVAFLQKSGIPFIREDLDAFRLHTRPD